MKRILITGAESYIGTGVERYLLQYNQNLGKEEYRIDTLDQRSEEWEKYDFSSYDTVFHVSGIAHADVGKISEKQKALYYRVNCDLAIQTARKAKTQGVHQFIFMSSVIVYGDSAPVGHTKQITARTEAAPANCYGDSKLQAEKGLRALSTEMFRVDILRPPFIYGPGCKGNYPLLSKIADKVFIFPNIKNQRSILYIDNLAEFVRRLIEIGTEGGYQIYFPQNAEYAATSQLVAAIAKTKGKRIRLWGICNFLIYLASYVPGEVGNMTNKAFGSLVIDRELSREKIKGYQIYSLEESIFRTEEYKQW